MEPEGSLPQSQVPVTCLYPEPAQSSPYHHAPLPKVPSYYHPIYTWVYPVVSLRQVSSPKYCIYLSLPPNALQAQRISFFSILSPAQ
jgi:hypothetical protein